MKRARAIAALAIALPVVGLGVGIVATEAQLLGASEWRVPITGYDPRDPLRGRYIAFSYVWQAEGDARQCRSGGCVLCLEDGGARVRIEGSASRCPARIDPAVSGLSIETGSGDRLTQVTAATRLWVSETRAPVLERQLQTRPMVAVARLTRGGRLLAERLEPAS